MESFSACGASRRICTFAKVFVLAQAGCPQSHCQLDASPLRLAVRRTVLLPRRSHTETPVHRALLCVGRHKRLPESAACRDGMRPGRRKDAGGLALSAAFEQMLGMLQARLGQLRAAQHPRNLLGPLRVVHPAHVRLRPPAFLRLLNQESADRQTPQSAAGA